ncbi:hypothetical protein NEMBOFW57_006366 [Staphylotrichum longicolle]|uniref:DUF7357 domain-containing protein n=1 Tax=Staphylotrichum longicolle TaxID=669026 RepID=A0AAD4F1X7_9PEZI|nr:hypothetical protein NEMBOFW57_006366 [Staphylotrichum longicolle]
MRDSNILRLRLVVKRHGLPEDRVMFAVQLDTGPTISNLLEQVNEVFPLESNDWGLEDYAVELRDATGRGFDCLHFQQVSVILKNDEEVLHLIDGVAFGRPRLKAPRDRPSVDIPPLKRPRITYEAGEEDDEEQRLLLTQHGEDASPGLHVRKRARFGDVEGSESDRDKEVEDSDFTDGGSEEGADEGEEDLDDSGLEDELRELNADNAQIQEDDVMEPEIPDTAAVPDRTAALDLDTLDKISALRVAFPTVPAEACERILSRHRGDTESAFLRLQSQHQPRIPLDALLASASPSAAPIIATAEDDASDESEAESIASMIKHFDQHGFPSGSILAGTAAAQMAEAMRRSGHRVKPPVHTKFDGDVKVHSGGEPSNPVEGKDTDNDEDNDSGSDSDYDSGNGSDSDDCSGSDNESNGGNDNGKDSASDSESSSDSDDDSGPEVASSKEPDALGGARLPEIRESSIVDGRRDDVSERISGSESDSSSDAETGESHSDDSDDSSSDDSGDDESRLDHSMSGNAEDDSSTDSSESDEADLSDDDSSDGSVDFSSKYLPSEKTPSILMEQTTPRGNSAQGRQRDGNAAVRDEDSTPTSGSPMSLAGGSQDLVASLAAKKAALLQSLDTAHEEQSRKANDALSSGNGNSFVVSQAPLPESSVLESSGGNQQPVSGDYTNSSVGGTGLWENSEAWRNKIVYRAVECCHDGVELSEPPFPFIQRWDPQQQYFPNGKNKRGGRSKRKQRNQEDFRDERSDFGAKRRRYGGGSLDNDADDDYGESFVSHDGTTACEEMVLNYDDETPETQEQPGQNTGQDFNDEDDLPPLPSDVSILPKLNPSEAMVGMILTWKQWILSKATNWQPQVSALAGVVVEVIDSNTLTVRLAKRDRNIDQNEKVYDDDGNRVYDKFELPGMDDEDEDAAEQGYRTLDLADMIEPRILQPVPGASGSTARSKSPSKTAVLSAIDARKPQIVRDLEYEEAMRRLDDSDDLSEDDTKDQLSKRARALMDKPIEKPTSKKPAQKREALKPSSAPPIKNERASTSPAPAVLRTARATSSPFAVPEGSQVVSLLTSSPEPELEEHYAEDSIDETYNEPNMPSGSGWVKKQRTRRGLSVAAGRDPVSKPQSQQSTDKQPTAALNSLLRAKKKVLANMF